MKNTKRKIVILTIVLLAIILPALKFYTSRKEEVSTSTNIKESYTVALGKNNASTSEEENITKIEKYNGNAKTVVIDKDTITSSAVEINYNAFAECNNLETILIDKTLISEETC